MLIIVTFVVAIDINNMQMSHLTHLHTETDFIIDW